MNVALRLNRESLKKGMLGLMNSVVKEEMAEVRKAAGKIRQVQPDKTVKNEYVKGKAGAPPAGAKTKNKT